MLQAPHVYMRYPDDVMIVLPADHYIADSARFQTVVRADVAGLVTMGVARPDTGYGYIACGEPVKAAQDVPAYRVERFTENPTVDRAREFLGSGRFLWNSGMFIWRADVVLGLIDRYLPELGWRESGASWTARDTRKRWRRSIPACLRYP